MTVPIRREIAEEIAQAVPRRRFTPASERTLAGGLAQTYAAPGNVALDLNGKSFRFFDPDEADTLALWIIAAADEARRG